MDKNVITPYVEHKHLVTESYPDSRNLSDRQRIYEYRTGPAFPDWLFDHIDGPLGRVLDVGAGPGFWMRKALERAELVAGMDLSPGMVGEAREASPHVAVADAEHIPFRTDAFDTTLCFHMLYHVQNIPAAIGELRRVNRPDGRVMVTTNGNDHMAKLRESFDEIVRKMSGRSPEPILSEARRFRLEDGEQLLKEQFDQVERHDLRSELTIPEQEPVVRYLQSIRGFHESKLPAGMSWDSLVEAFAQHVQSTIDKEGAFKISTHAGAFICQ
ncbi:MAG TPA: methyltransferase domain-containing protein [Actinomycetota bacterium]|nr:methyltransferase domain-containing protein [Actinomycetota bacterium]